LDKARLTVAKRIQAVKHLLVQPTARLLSPQAGPENIHPLPRLSESPNTTHGSGWIVQLQLTPRRPRPIRYYPLHFLFLAFARKRIKMGTAPPRFLGRTWTIHPLSLGGIQDSSHSRGFILTLPSLASMHYHSY